MSIHVMSANLSAFGADRAKMLYDEGTIAHVRCPLWPEDSAALANQAEWPVFVSKGVPMWAWINCSSDQEADVATMRELDAEFQPQGWVLDIEKSLERADLSFLCKGAKTLNKPVITSVSGANPNHNLYDHRSLDRAGFWTEWQAYEDSGEGPSPATAVRELYLPSRVGVGWEYRARIDGSYGWGRITERDVYRSYPKRRDYLFRTIVDNGWPPLLVIERRLNGNTAGRLLGLVPYSKIRVCILSDGLAADHGVIRTPEEWTAYAASARAPGLARKGMSVFVGERASDEMLRAVAKGAG